MTDSDKHVSTLPTICHAIQRALDRSWGLQFHIQELLTNCPEKDFLIPDDYQPPEYPAKPPKSLWKLLDDDALSRVRLVSENARISLAIQLLLGPVTSMGYGCTMATWDPKKVFVRFAAGRGQTPNMFPYVSCVKGTDEDWFDLPKPEEVGESEKPVSHSLVFIKMAKLLLEIGDVGFLGQVEPDANGDHQKLRNNLQTAVRSRMLAKDYGPTSLATTHYILAADRCLQFSFLYIDEVSRLKRNWKPEATELDIRTIVENIIYHRILPELEKGYRSPSNVGSVDSVMATRDRAKGPWGAGEQVPIKSHRHIDADPPPRRIVATPLKSPNISPDDRSVSSLSPC